MRRIRSIMMILSLLLILTSCSESLTTVPAPTPSSGMLSASPSVSPEGPIELTNEDNLFKLTLHMKKTEFAPGEKIDMSATLEYVGDRDEVTIRHSEPYVHFIVKGPDDFSFGGAAAAISKPTTLRKNEKYEFPFHKAGGYSSDDPKAEFWKSFYAEKDLYLSKGTYHLNVYSSFTLPEDIRKGDYSIAVETDFVVK